MQHLGRRLLFSVCAAALLTGPLAAQTARTMPDAPVPEGVPLVTLLFANVESATDQYNNGGHDENKVVATGLGPLLYGIFLAGTGGNPLGVSKNFEAIKVRTTGHIWGAAMTYGVTDDVTAQLTVRMLDATARIQNGDAAASPFVGGSEIAAANATALAAGAEPLGNATFHNELLDAELNFAAWGDETKYEDGGTYRGAITGGITYRGGKSVGSDLLEYALVELARLDRPPYLRFGYKGVLDYESGFRVSYGAELAYHLEGQTIVVNPSNAAFNAGGGSPSRPLIEDVRSDDHLGVLASLKATQDMGQGWSVSGGSWLDYEDRFYYKRVSQAPVPVKPVNENQAEYRLFYTLGGRYNGIAAETIPIIAELEWNQSIAGRNQSKLQVLALKVSVPLARPKNKGGGA
ncbi:MAG: hypothetical protein H6825_04115 [Planctomycetes bacterium]|nr:hypothetical protein [Planctomycetota bacterium]